MQESYYVFSRRIMNQSKIFINSMCPLTALIHQTAQQINHTTNDPRIIWRRAFISTHWSFDLCKYCLSHLVIFTSNLFFFCICVCSVGSHFEDDVIGTFIENASVEYSVSSSSDSSPITGAPVSYQDNIDISTHFSANNLDFGEFLDSTADISPKLKHAVCGKLSVKYVYF